MCELFGVNSSVTVNLNAYLKTFMSHSVDHPNGWGIAQFFGNVVNLEKEPRAAVTSDYLYNRLEDEINAQNLIAHIRLATCGQMKYNNCHPFLKRDQTGRTWTMAHNGTIFQSPLLDTYKTVEKGSTDSERILCHIIQKMNETSEKLGRALSEEERFSLMDKIILEITEFNKVNLLVYDGEILYVHTNMKHTLFYKQDTQTIYFATVPLDDSGWIPMPMMKLCAYRKGTQIFTGTQHEHEYIKQDTQPIYDWGVL